MTLHGMIFDIQRPLPRWAGDPHHRFLKVPLRCQWCHNPESWSFEQEVFYSHDGTTWLWEHYTVDEVMAVVADRPTTRAQAARDLVWGRAYTQFLFGAAWACKAQASILAWKPAATPH